MRCRIAYTVIEKYGGATVVKNAGAAQCSAPSCRKREFPYSFSCITNLETRAKIMNRPYLCQKAHSFISG